MVVVMIMSTIALKEDSEGEEIQKGSEEEQGSKTLSAGPDPKAQEKGQE
jgi:hypothetical protein